MIYHALTVVMHCFWCLVNISNKKNTKKWVLSDYFKITIFAIDFL